MYYKLEGTTNIPTESKIEIYFTKPMVAKIVAYSMQQDQCYYDWTFQLIDPNGTVVETW